MIAFFCIEKSFYLVQIDFELLIRHFTCFYQSRLLSKIAFQVKGQNLLGKKMVVTPDRTENDENRDKNDFQIARSCFWFFCWITVRHARHIFSFLLTSFLVIDDKTRVRVCVRVRIF